MAIITLQCDRAWYDRLTYIICIDTISENLISRVMFFDHFLASLKKANKNVMAPLV